MKGYKGFSHGMICQGKQYSPNTEYEEDEAKICEKGMHFCENPLDVFRFYPPVDRHGNLNEFAEVEAEDAKTDDGIKYVTKKMKVGSKLSVSQLVNAGVDFLFEKKDGSTMFSAGYGSASVNNGYRSAAVNTGEYSAAVNNGYNSAAVSTGSKSAAASTGDRSAAVNNGDYSSAVSTGSKSAAVNNGDYSSASVSGKDGIAVVLGRDSKAKGAVGDWLVLTERDDYNIIGVKAVRVDGRKIKAETWYRLQGGKVKAERSEE